MKKNILKTAKAGSIASTTLACLLLAGSANAVTLLVNFAGAPTAGKTVQATTAANFQSQHAAVESGAPVNTVGASGATVTGTEGSSFTVTTTQSAYFVANDTTATFGTTPILDSYIYGDNFAPTATITSIEEIGLGQSFTLVVYGVGDAANQDANLSVTYNGLTLGPTLTEADGTAGGYNGTFGTFTFTKAAADSIVISSDPTFRYAAINGFSLTSVPEPTSAVLLGTFGGLALLRRRK